MAIVMQGTKFPYLESCPVRVFHDLRHIHHSDAPTIADRMMMELGKATINQKLLVT
jgi:hypothetical protein